MTANSLAQVCIARILQSSDALFRGGLHGHVAFVSASVRLPTRTYEAPPPRLRTCLMVRPRVSRFAAGCTRILLAWGEEGRGNRRVARRRDGIRSACVSDVLMTLRNTEQANQYGRHCVHSGARHVPPRVIASGNVSAASECRNESVHVRPTSFRDTVDLPSAIEIYEVVYAKLLREEIPKSDTPDGNDSWKMHRPTCHRV